MTSTRSPYEGQAENTTVYMGSVSAQDAHHLHWHIERGQPCLHNQLTHPHQSRPVTKDTTKRLLFCGWNRQHCTFDAESEISLTHLPVADSHSRQLPSEDADAMKSLATDQSKSLTEEVWPRRVCKREGGSVRRLKMERVPSREQLTKRVLSS